MARFTGFDEVYSALYVDFDNIYTRFLEADPEAARAFGMAPYRWVRWIENHALRILYEKGLDLMTHSNGLGYEESERFINYCHLTKPANYLPVMCEEAGGTAAVINMLLLQEIDGVIHVFPAVPDGEDRYAGTKTEYYHDDRCVSAKYGPWKDISFEGMLAPGGFEVSAQMRDGRTVWIRIKCRVPGKVRLAVPESLAREAECHAGLHAGISQDSGGKICEEGPPEQIFGDPKNERLREFLSKVL